MMTILISLKDNEVQFTSDLKNPIEADNEVLEFTKLLRKKKIFPRLEIITEKSKIKYVQEQSAMKYVPEESEMQYVPEESEIKYALNESKSKSAKVSQDTFIKLYIYIDISTFKNKDEIAELFIPNLKKKVGKTPKFFHDLPINYRFEDQGLIEALINKYRRGPL